MYSFHFCTITCEQIKRSNWNCSFSKRSALEVAVEFWTLNCKIINSFAYTLNKAKYFYMNIFLFATLIPKQLHCTFILVNLYVNLWLLCKLSRNPCYIFPCLIIFCQCLNLLLLDSCSVFRFRGTALITSIFPGELTVRENIGHPGIRKGNDIIHQVVIEELMAKAVLIPF